MIVFLIHGLKIFANRIKLKLGLRQETESFEDGGYMGCELEANEEFYETSIAFPSMKSLPKSNVIVLSLMK